MKSILISTEMDIITGLRLVGINGHFVKNSDELKSAFNMYSKKEDIGIIVITEDDFTIIKDEVTELKLKKKIPLVATIPGQGGLKDKDMLLKYVKESVGIKI